jgi:hypothetical protein
VKISNEVEPVVREAFATSVAGERDRFTTALESVAALGEDRAREALELALSVSSSALLTVHRGARPGDEQLARLAGELADDAEDWSDDITPANAAMFLYALADGRAPAAENGVARRAGVRRRWMAAVLVPARRRQVDRVPRPDPRLAGVLSSRPRGRCLAGQHVSS